MRELNRDTSRVLREVAGGTRVIVTRSGEPVAVVLDPEQAIDLMLISSQEYVRMRLEAGDKARLGVPDELGDEFGEPLGP